MEYLKQPLLESGVIDRVLDDFNPRLQIILPYGDREIGIGDQITSIESQRLPSWFDHYHNVHDLELQEIFRNPKLVACMITDPDAPGGEYLQWLTLTFVSTESDAVDMPVMELVAYEPPRSGARMLVFTLFKTHEFQSIIPPNSRENFSTRAFAHNNALGSPVGASFFYIKDENEDKKRESACRAGRNYKSSSSIKKSCVRVDIFIKKI